MSVPAETRPSGAPAAAGHPEATAAPAIRSVALCKSFGEREVVRGLTFDVGAGQILGIVGPSGCGKTTTVRMMLGVLRPTSGELRVLGRQPHELRGRDGRGIGYMPQLFVLFPELTVAQNVSFVAGLYGVSTRERMREVLEFAELWDARDRLASQLSGGMQRRLELAATLVHDPSVIFLDEPTAGVDPVLRAKFWDHFRQLRDEGRTLVVTTQYVTEAEYCDQVAVLADGELVAIGSPDEIRRRTIGGDVFSVTGPNLDRRALEVIGQVPGVQRVRRIDEDRLEVVVDDAGQVVADLVEVLRQAAIPVDEIEEEHPSFDEVFIRLMQARGPRAA